MNKTLLTRTAMMAAFTAIMAVSHAQINRQAVVSRNNPQVHAIDSLQSLSVGNGGFAMTVDATGLQTFPELYKNGVPLGTMSDWGWHSFPNTENYRAEEALQPYDFGHTSKPGKRKKETYSVENKADQRAKAAAAYLRANPHRLHLGTVGLGISKPDKVEAIHQHLDLWTGTIDSRFSYNGKCYHVTTVCHPERDIIATRVCVELQNTLAKGDNRESIIMRFPYPTGAHSDDACQWDNADNRNWERHHTQIVEKTDSGALLKRTIDDTSYYVNIRWQGKPVKVFNDGSFPLENLLQEFGFAGTEFSFVCEFLPNAPTTTTLPTFDETAQASAGFWHDYWTKGGIIDFSHCTDPRARELERRAVLSQYLLAVNCAGDTPPQETGLTYNSWFGKFHLEMIWWHQAQFALYGHPELLERSLDWYFKAAPVAREIAERQGFDGLRWMKMTDPSAQEAPSKVGSFLIWQQPHLIHLAELLRRADGDGMRIVRKFWPLVKPTAAFMQSFADYEKKNGRYVLKGIIPAQETLRAAETKNPPFELSYWQWGLTTADTWSTLMGEGHQAQWQLVAQKLSPLAYNSDSLYLAAETATDTYRDIRFTSDHPAILGALGILPGGTLTDKAIMKKTLNWIWDNWNWDKTWGWDYPMVAMNAARLGEREKAVDALLMPKRTNTYLVSGHNYQDQRLRLYLPGNGGLLTALAMMCAGWDGCQERNPGFPDNGQWDVRWEGLLPLP